MVEVTLLGTSGTMPVKGKWLSSALIRCLGSSFLFDCGEGTQMAARAVNMPLGGIDVICITHFHGDHIGGLPGLLLSMGHEGRTKPVDIYGPLGLTQVVTSICILAASLPFEVRLHELDVRDMESVHTIGPIRIQAFPLVHSVPCIGYTFSLLRSGKFDAEKAKQNNVPLALWSQLQKDNQPVEFGGVQYTQDMVLGPERKGIHVLYATDTRPTALLEKAMAEKDLCILEGMYGNDDKKERAVETLHMTFTEVAFMASRACPKAVWFTHYSPSLPDPETYIEEACSIYPSLTVGTDGMQTNLLYED